MSKQVKQNCQRMIEKMQARLEDLRIAIKTKKSQSILEKVLCQIINDFKFFQDQFKIISHHLSFLQTKSYEKDILISTYEKEIMTKNAEKNFVQQMIRSKYEKITKQHKFLDFVGKNGSRHELSHHRYKSEFIKKGLTELEKDIAESNKRVCSKVKELQNQIQNEEQGYLTFQNNALFKNNFFEANVSSIAPDGNFFPSPSKALEKKEKLKALHLGMDENITDFKTIKKDLGSKIVEDQIEMIQEREPKSSQTVVINKKKREELADLIAQQTKIYVSKEKYFSTDI